MTILSVQFNIFEPYSFCLAFCVAALDNVFFAIYYLHVLFSLYIFYGLIKILYKQNIIPKTKIENIYNLNK